MFKSCIVSWPAEWLADSGSTVSPHLVAWVEKRDRAGADEGARRLHSVWQDTPNPGHGLAAALDRHERRREEAMPCLSVLVGIESQTRRVIEQWVAERSRIVVQAAGPGLEALTGVWLKNLTAQRDLVPDAVAWLSRASGQLAEELNGWIARASLFDLERFLDRTATGAGAEVCRWILNMPTARGELTPVRLLGTLAAMIPNQLTPVYLAMENSGASAAEGWMEAAVSSLARLAEASPSMSLMLAVAPEVFERYLCDAPESRAKFLARNGMIRVSTPPDAVEQPVASAVRALEIDDDDPARSVAERLLFERLETLSATSGLFTLNATLDIPFGLRRAMEVDLWAESLKLAVEIDGYYHFQGPDAYRRDRRKDLALQRRGHLVVRVLAEDVMERPEDVLEVILEAVATCRDRGHPVRGVIQ
jgi:Protein of unknown function (DUF559)